MPNDRFKGDRGMSVGGAYPPLSKEHKLNDTIIESHCTHILEGDIGEVKHARVMHVLKQYPEEDYLIISRIMDALDKQEYDTCRLAIKKAAESQADRDF